MIITFLVCELHSVPLCSVLEEISSGTNVSCDSLCQRLDKVSIIP